MWKKTIYLKETHLIKMKKFTELSLLSKRQIWKETPLSFEALSVIDFVQF